MNDSMKMVRLSVVFSISHGNKLDFNKMDVADSPADGVAFITRSGERNGIVSFVKPLPNHEPFPEGLITVALGGAALSSFVQASPFYTAQNIDVLRPINPMSLDEKLYYCLCIEANAFRYSTFGREANRSLKNLLVPARESIPPWVCGATKAATESLRDDLLSAVE